MAAKPERRFKVVADNRKARFNYEIGETFEAGIALTGTEVKSLRAGKATIAESYADARGGEIWLINANIPEYLQAHRFNHAPKRPRKLLLHTAPDQQARRRGRARGHDHRAAQALFQREGPRQDRDRARARQEAARQARDAKKRSWERERGRLMRQKG